MVLEYQLNLPVKPVDKMSREIILPRKGKTSFEYNVIIRHIKQLEYKTMKHRSHCKCIVQISFPLQETVGKETTNIYIYTDKKVRMINTVEKQKHFA